MTSPEASATRVGSSDALMRLMKRMGVPVTRENYLDLAYMGRVPELGAEEEANLPSSLRRQE